MINTTIDVGDIEEFLKLIKMEREQSVLGMRVGFH